MVVKCINNITFEFELLGINDDFGDPIISNYFNICGDKCVYSIEVNECYKVYAIAMINGKLHYLLLGSTGFPQFYKANLFQIIENDIFELNFVSYFENEFISYLISNEYLSNVEIIKKIIRKDSVELLNFYKYTKNE